MAWVVTVGEHRAEVAPALVTVPARAEAQVAAVEAMEAGAEVPRTSALVREWSLVGPKATVAVVLPARTRAARLKGPSSLMLDAPAPPQAWRTRGRGHQGQDRLCQIASEPESLHRSLSRL